MHKAAETLRDEGRMKCMGIVRRNGKCKLTILSFTGSKSYQPEMLILYDALIMESLARLSFHYA